MHRSFVFLCLLLLFKTALMIVGMLSWEINLGPDEAQYWTWSKSLDWGYYSKPPAIAWQIWIGSQLFGDTEFGVRFMSLIVGILIPIAVYFLARACNLTPQTSFWAGAIMAFAPIGIMSSFFATTDGGMVLFWTLACIVITSSLTKGQTPNYFLFGLLILFGALYKWPIYLLWLLVLIGIPFIPLLKSKNILAGMLISLFGLFPSFIWNIDHDWATFRHVFATIKGEHYYSPEKAGKIFQGNFFEFIGMQAIFLFPIFFILLIFALVYLIRKRKELTSSIKFCGIVSISILAVYTFLALFKKMQGNWSVFAYPTSLVLVAWYANEIAPKMKKWLWIGAATSFIFCLCIFSYAHQIPFKSNPFKHTLGWDKLSTNLNDVGYNQQNDFLFGDKYQMSSILSFYGPNQKRAYFLNISGVRKNQFSYWKGMKDEQIGKDGFFVLTENTPYLNKLQDIEKFEKLLQPYFDKVQFMGTHELLKQKGKMVKGALIFKGIGYNGKVPPEKRLY